MRRTWGVAVALVIAGLAITGCTETSDDSSARSDSSEGLAAAATDDSDTAAAEEVPSTTWAGAQAQRASDEDNGGGGMVAASAPLPDIDAKVVRTADLRIEVEEGAFAEAFRSASALARALGGFVQASSTSSYEEGSASGDVTLRVPVDRFDEAMTRLGELGTLVSSSEEGEDVSGQLVDIDARLRALRAEEDALNALMAEAGNVNEVLSVRGTAVGIRQEIEQLAAQQKSLADRAAYSTIHVLLHEATAAVAEEEHADGSWDLARAFRTAVDAGEAVVGSMIVAIGLAVPLAPLALLAWWVNRRIVRRRAAEAT